MLSNTCKYAVRAVTYLAIHEEKNKKIGLKQISEELEIPAPFLGKILQMLAKNKLLSSTKGPHGGFSLGREADEIWLYDIVEIIDGFDAFDSCLFGYKTCKNLPEKQDTCPIHPKSGPVRKQLLDLYKSQSVGEIAKKYGKEKTSILF